jgi:hypothetical protein
MVDHIAQKDLKEYCSNIHGKVQEQEQERDMNNQEQVK